MGSTGSKRLCQDQCYVESGQRGVRIRDYPHSQSPPSLPPTPQGHLQALEGTAENQQALLTGLDYLVNLSYVDNIEVSQH